MTTFIISSLDQFEIRNLLSLDAPILGNLSLSITNIDLYFIAIAGAESAIGLGILVAFYRLRGSIAIEFK